MEFKHEDEFDTTQSNVTENTEHPINEENIEVKTDSESAELKDVFEFQEEGERVETAPSMEQTRAAGLADKKPPKKLNIKGIASTVVAGVIGSALTLAVLPHTDYLKNFYPDSINQPVSTSSGSSAKVKPVSAQPSAVSSSSIADTVEKVSKAIVGIVNYQQSSRSNSFYGMPSSSQNVETGSGSGVIFQKNNENAYIVTNNHVIEGANELEVSLYNGEKTKAEVIGSDALTDLAVLKIDSKYVTDVAVFGDSSTLRPGDQVFAIGNPLGSELSRTVTQGIISAINRSIDVNTSAGNWETNVIQTDAAINPGNSGGALINTAGQVIGINSLKISEDGVEGLGFAIPSSDFIPIVNKLIKDGKIERPYLGVSLADLEQVPQGYVDSLPNSVTKGVYIAEVQQNSVADKAGLKARDVIVSMNGTEIASSSDLRKYLYTKVSKGDQIKFGVYRDGKEMTLTAILTE
ncbi:S1C family serine protease [Neobacillus dielmonensis]|uniref:S1C family serine protease n=1 Tax=Neobacillus dielmonensis TaxID=1347369 RepID=UPI0009DF2471|nr:trypsin-like peptidase domain-containing protein [Neobacillus dielmonensis]